MAVVAAPPMLTFVAQHERYSKQAVLATRTPLDLRRRHFEAVDEEEGEKDDILGHLGRRENIVNPFAKLIVWLGQGGQSRYRGIRGSGTNRFGSPQVVCSFKPKEARHLQKETSVRATRVRLSHLDEHT